MKLKKKPKRFAPKTVRLRRQIPNMVSIIYCVRVNYRTCALLAEQIGAAF